MNYEWNFIVSLLVYAIEVVTQIIQKETRMTGCLRNPITLSDDDRGV